MFRPETFDLVSNYMYSSWNLRLESSFRLFSLCTQVAHKMMELENKDLDATVLNQAVFPICFNFKDRLFGSFSITCTDCPSMCLNCLPCLNLLNFPSMVLTEKTQHFFLCGFFKRCKCKNTHVHFCHSFFREYSLGRLFLFEGKQPHGCSLEIHPPCQ